MNYMNTVTKTSLKQWLAKLVTGSSTGNKKWSRLCVKPKHESRKANFSQFYMIILWLLEGILAWDFLFTPKIFFILWFKIHREIEIYCNFTNSANLHSFVLRTWWVHMVSFCMFGAGTHLYCAYLQMSMVQIHLKIYLILLSKMWTSSCLFCQGAQIHSMYSANTHRFIPHAVFRKGANIILIIWNQIIFFDSF